MTSPAPGEPPGAPHLVAPGFAPLPPKPSASPADEYVIDLRFLGRTILRARWFALLAFVLGAGYGYWMLAKFDPSYQAFMVVSPSRSSETASSDASPAIGAARALGLAFGDRGAINFDRLTQLIGSLQLAERLQRKYGLMQTIFADGYDGESKTWRRPSDAAFERKEYLRALLRQTLWRPPDIDMLADYLKAAVNVRNMDPLPFVKLSYGHADPVMARFILEIVYAEADALLREQDLLENSRRKAYLQDQLNKVTVQDIRAVLLRLLTSAEQSAMLLESNLPYAARIVEPPRAPVQTEAANLFRIVGIPALTAPVLVIVLFLLVALLRRE